MKYLWDQSAPEQGMFLSRELSVVGAAWEELIARQLLPKTSGKVLDLGCGTGFMSLMLAKKGFEVTAADFSATMLDEAKKAAVEQGVNERIHFVEQDISELDFPAESFDIVVSRYSSWLVSQPEQAYRKCFELLSEDGILLTFDANWMLPMTDEQVRQRFEEDEKELVATFGSFEDYYHNHEMMEIFKQLPLAKQNRPSWDESVCKAIGFQNVCSTFDLGEGLHLPFFAVRYRQMPTFLVRAEKKR